MKREVDCWDCGRLETRRDMLRRSWREWQHRNDPKPEPNYFALVIHDQILNEVRGWGNSALLRKFPSKDSDA